MLRTTDILQWTLIFLLSFPKEWPHPPNAQELRKLLEKVSRLSLSLVILQVGFT